MTTPVPLEPIAERLEIADLRTALSLERAARILAEEQRDAALRKLADIEANWILTRRPPRACPWCGAEPYRTFEGACTMCGEPHK